MDAGQDEDSISAAKSMSQCELGCLPTFPNVCPSVLPAEQGSAQERRAGQRGTQQQDHLPHLLAPYSLLEKMY